MAKSKSNKKRGRLRGAGGRVTLKPCDARDGSQYCAPLNHVQRGDDEFWTCSCGRRYNRNGYRKFVKDHPEWRSDEEAAT